MAIVIVAFCLIAAASDPRFLSASTLTDLLRASIVLGILAVGAMLVLVSGGIDVSFTAIAVFAMYATTGADPRHRAGAAVVPDLRRLDRRRAGRSGAINGLFIAGFGLPTLIVTPRYPVGVPRLPADLRRLRAHLQAAAGGCASSPRAMIVRGTTEGGSFYALPLALRRACRGRRADLVHPSPHGARGARSSRSAARSRARAGSASTCARVQFFVYVYVGALAGLAGIIHGRIGTHV